MEETKRIPIAGRWDWPHPSHWKWYFLESLLKTGKPVQGNPAVQLKETEPQGPILALFSEDLQNTKEIRARHYLSEDKLEELQSKHTAMRVFRERTLMIATARDTTMGRVGILNQGQVAVSNHVVIGLVPLEERLLLDFLYYYFRLDKTRDYLQNILAPGRESISPEVLGKVRVPVPPIEEQRRLVRRIETLTFDLRNRRAQLQRTSNTTLKALAQTIHASFRPVCLQHRSSIPLAEYLTFYEGAKKQPRFQRQQNGAALYSDYLYLTEANIEPFTGRLLNPTLVASLSQQVKNILVLDQMRDIILYGARAHNQSPTSVRLPSELASSGDEIEHFQAFPVLAQLPDESEKHLACHTDMLALRFSSSDPVSKRFLFWSLLADTVTIDGLPLSSHINKSSIKHARVLWPRHAERLQIVRHLDAIQTHMNVLRKQQDQDLARLDELEQSILEQAFQGRL